MASAATHERSPSLTSPADLSGEAGESKDAVETTAPLVTKPATSASETRGSASPVGSETARTGTGAIGSSAASPTGAQRGGADVMTSSAAADEEPAPHGTETPRDPKVDQLRALFPNVDLEIVETVLAASGGSLDEATEQLLILSDPSYKPDPVEVRLPCL